MIKPKDPRELAEAILTRSSCSVQVGAVLADRRGIFSWGWNSQGPDGFGMHAEHHCYLRANRERASSGVMFVASRRARNSKIVNSKPCEQCQRLLSWADIQTIWYRNGEGLWVKL